MKLDIISFSEEKFLPPLLSLGVVVAVGAVLSSIAFGLFWFSDTRDTVKTIQQTSRNDQQYVLPAAGVNDDGVLKTDELLFIKEGVIEQRSLLNPESDFGSKQLDPANLGF